MQGLPIAGRFGQWHIVGSKPTWLGRMMEFCPCAKRVMMRLAETLSSYDQAIARRLELAAYESAKREHQALGAISEDPTWLFSFSDNYISERSVNSMKVDYPKYKCN
jgi:hypothetical protein